MHLAFIMDDAILHITIYHCIQCDRVYHGEKGGGERLLEVNLKWLCTFSMKTYHLYKHDKGNMSPKVF